MGWAEVEMAGADLGDKRLDRRLIRLLDRLGEAPAASIPSACQGWAEVQAAYRFLANDKVSWEGVLAPHWECTRERMREPSLVLCIQDTTELDFTSQPGIQGLGPLSYIAQHGMYIHPTLAVTGEGVPLGVLDAWMWAREAAHHGQDKRHWPLEARESMRWLEGYERVAELAATLPDTRLVYVADRECDIHDFMLRAEQLGTPADWLIRAAQARCTDNGVKLWQRLEAAEVLGEVRFHLPAQPQRPARAVTQSLRVERVRLTPRGKAPVEVTALLAREENPPPGQPALEWRLLTNRPVQTLEQAAEVLDWYRKRWTVEVFFRIYKQGCKVEALQLGSLERLEPALALYLIIAWRVQYLMLLGRECPALPCDLVLAPEEWRTLYIVAKRQAPPSTPPTLGEALRLLAGFGGWLGRKSDGPPGPKAIWTGLQRLRDFMIGMQAFSQMHDQSYG